MNCDKGNKTEIFHKAQRWSGGEHDDMRSKPLWGIACVLVCARRRRQTGGGNRCCMRYVHVRLRRGGRGLLQQIISRKREFFLIWT